MPMQVLAEEMVGRLRSAESLKLALLAREQAEIERELEALHALVRVHISKSVLVNPCWTTILI